MTIDSQELAAKLQNTLGKEVSVTSEVLKTKPDWLSSARLVTYSSETQSVRLLMSHKLAVILGGAFAMVPPGGVEDEYTNAEFSELIGESFHEICNIIVSSISRTFNDTFALAEVPHKLNDDFIKKIEQLKEFETYTVIIGGGYQPGSFVFMGQID